MNKSTGKNIYKNTHRLINLDTLDNYMFPIWLGQFPEGPFLLSKLNLGAFSVEGLPIQVQAT